MDLLSIVAVIAKALDSLRIPYLIGGSIASSIYGIPRATQDVDFVVDLEETQVPALVAVLESEFYIDAKMIYDAIRRRESFNIIHLASMYKIDLFIVKPTRWARRELERRRLEQIEMERGVLSCYLASPEDTILHKLHWFQLGSGVSERQWNDVLGVLKVQAESLDLAYLREEAVDLGVADLLDQAIVESGMNNDT